MTDASRDAFQKWAADQFGCDAVKFPTDDEPVGIMGKASIDLKDAWLAWQSRDVEVEALRRERDEALSALATCQATLNEMNDESASLERSRAVVESAKSFVHHTEKHRGLRRDYTRKVQDDAYDALYATVAALPPAAAPAKWEPKRGDVVTWGLCRCIYRVVRIDGDGVRCVSCDRRFPATEETFADERTLRLATPAERLAHGIPEGPSAPPKCPTCGSDKPDVSGWDDAGNLRGSPDFKPPVVDRCNDAFHAPRDGDAFRVGDRVRVKAGARPGAGSLGDVTGWTNNGWIVRLDRTNPTSETILAYGEHEIEPLPASDAGRPIDVLPLSKRDAEFVEAMRDAASDAKGVEGAKDAPYDYPGLSHAEAFVEIVKTCRAAVRDGHRISGHLIDCLEFAHRAAIDAERASMKGTP